MIYCKGNFFYFLGRIWVKFGSIQIGFGLEFLKKIGPNWIWIESDRSNFFQKGTGLDRIGGIFFRKELDWIGSENLF